MNCLSCMADDHLPSFLYLVLNNDPVVDEDVKVINDDSKSVVFVYDENNLVSII